ncbi:interferon-inducible protein AIM2 isoform X1 [Rattus norvegicus]|uniref:Absent in melanoma 2 n=2 Tax=Rattus norvegicus TaxID=10116 RepID=D4A9W0_RAT|nr:interferon-inducible protein AIM2 isoform X1 [Rattus norvegicus]XP_008768024.1 interferon-inducible protein AIM2 isoform X1 [Rattus norvegicus]XP_038947354.1 interferon-inducible protein AIM2 isoform X1 [Rattus norvegicus]XP_222949.5 interferon-inducible protein AIM2 isoform X1 [Rattus norvegicus]|eukprot:XP_006250397.1 PREDICTED: interferon-inducible protein AIM2 [Rattus norvegicus]
MESDFREMLLLTGLDHITEEELKRFKYLALTEFNIPRKTLNIADRTELADQLIQSAGAASAVAKAISIFQKLNYMDIAKALEEKKKEAESKYVTNTKKRGTQKVENRSQAKNCSVASATCSDKDFKGHSATEVCPQVKPQKKQMVAEQEAIREDLQQDSLVVMVLKAMNPFECETQEGKQKIFHATVATETEFFFVKVLNAQFKDKFIPKRTIQISNYLRHSYFVEVTSSSVVVDVESSHKVCVPNNIMKKAGETPKISKLKTLPCGTIVNGLFKVQKITEQKDRVIYGIHDKRGTMEVLVLGNQSKTKCEEGDKIRLTFFEVSNNRGKIQLKSGPCSIYKVIKAAKPKTKVKSVE